MPIRFARTVLLALTVSAGVAFPQAAEFGIHVGQSRVSNSDIGSFSNQGSTTQLSLDDGFRFGFRVTLNNYRFFGNEFGYAYNRTQLVFNQAGLGEQKQGTAIHQGFFNFLGYATPEGSRIRPFGTGGVHFSTYPFPGTSVSQGSGTTKFGINYGGGIKVRITTLFNIRLDYREYRNGKPDFIGNDSVSGWLRQREISAGFGLVL